MNKYYEVTFNARHLWIILFVSLGLILFSFLLGIWVGSYNVPENAVETAATESRPAEVIPLEPELEPVDLSQAVVPSPPEEEQEKPSEPAEIDTKQPSHPAPSDTGSQPESHSASSPEKVWTVQVMAISNATRAQTWVQRLLAAGYDTYLETQRYPNQTLYRVRIGRYATREQADKTRKKLASEPLIQKENLTPWVTRL